MNSDAGCKAFYGKVSVAVPVPVAGFRIQRPPFAGVSKASRFTHTLRPQHLTYNQEGKAGRLTYARHWPPTTSLLAGCLGVAGELIG
jgi:hypothetical protein